MNSLCDGKYLVDATNALLLSCLRCYKSAYILCDQFKLLSGVVRITLATCNVSVFNLPNIKLPLLRRISIF